jgi:hypothetical protein
MCGTTHKTVRRIIERAEAGGKTPDRAGRSHNYDLVAELVADRVGATKGRISARRLLPAAKAAGYPGVGAELPAAGRGGEADVASR